MAIVGHVNSDGTDVDEAPGFGTAYPYSSVAAQVNVSAFGAKGDGTTDDSAAIQAALNACPPGGEVLLPSTAGGAAYRIGTPLTIPPFVTLRGTYGERDQIGGGFVRLKPFQSISPATAVIRLLDKEEGNYSVENRGVVIKDITIDGSALGATVCDGIRATGYAHGVRLENVGIFSVTGDGVKTSTYTRVSDSITYNPYSWQMHNVQVQTVTGMGFNFTKMSDMTASSCRTINSGGNGWSISGGANSVYSDCRAEWSGGYGFYITGSFGTATGSGGARFMISTDRNTKDGVFIDATGNGPLVFLSPMLRRDGRNANTGGGGYAGIRAASATIPIIITSPSVYPGVDDDTTGTNSPQYGVSFTGCTFVQLDGAGVLHAATAGYNDGGSNTVLRRGDGIVDRSGTTSSPSAVSYSPTPSYPGNTGFPAGFYEFPVSWGATSTSATLGNSTEVAVPFYWEPGTPAITRIGAEVTVVGQAGSVLRLGIRADDPANRRPGTLLVDFGTVAGDAVAVPEITGLNFTPGQPGWYWYTVTVQNASTTQPTVRTGTQPTQGYKHAIGTSVPSAGTSVAARKQTAVTGALPSTWTDGGTAGSAPRVWFKH